MAQFDGSCLYEHKDPRQGAHPHWGTLIYNSVSYTHLDVYKRQIMYIASDVPAVPDARARRLTS